VGKPAKPGRAAANRGQRNKLRLPVRSNVRKVFSFRCSTSAPVLLESSSFVQAPQGAEDKIGGASSELRQPAERKKIRGRRRRGEPQHLRINPSFTDDVQLTRTPTLRLRLRKRFAALMRDSTNG
jgi:hypothetical protein